MFETGPESFKAPGRDCHNRFWDYKFTEDEEAPNFARDYQVNKVRWSRQKIREPVRELHPDTNFAINMVTPQLKSGLFHKLN